MDALKKEQLLKIFLFSIVSLTLISLGMIYSASYMYAMEEFGSSNYIFLKQLVFVIISCIAILIISRSKFEFWYKNIFYIHVFFTFLVLMTFFPGVGVKIKGASRWINLGFINIQPGEFVKYSTLLTGISFFHHFPIWKKEEVIKKGIILFAPLILLMFQPDYGMFFLCFSNILFACFLSNFPRKWFYGFLVSSLVLMSGVLVLAPYRVKRLMSYLDPWSDPSNTGFQIIQSFLAFAHGSILGAGIGNSREKLFYLPEAHNDFIFSVIGEELGFLGVFLIVSLFVVFAFSGLKLAIAHKDNVKSSFSVLVVLTLCFQAILNMSVVLGLLPTKGLNLPMISYGGSSLLANALLLGVFFSLYIKKNERRIFETAL